jgi:ABC-type branched-subunit amino acid transport system ATPase component/predicted MFS family arabinose efflux permease
MSRPNGEGRARKVPSVADPTGMAPSRDGSQSFRQRGWENFKQTMHEASQFGEIRKGPYGLKPVFVFTIIGAVIAVDSRVLSIALPEIVKDLDLDIFAFIGVINIIGFFLIFVALGFAWWADRTRRLPFVAIGTVVTGVSSVLASFVSHERTFGATRAVDAVGSGIASVPTASLEADYYPVAVRGKVFALEGVIGRVFAVAAPIIVGLLVTATALEWRLPYLITGPLLVVGGVATLVLLREPLRGYMERKAMGLSEEEASKPEEPVSFGEAWRTIWAVRTLRRLFISQIPGNAGDFIFGIWFNLLLVEEYGLQIRERSFLFAGLAAVALPFGFYAGGVVDVLIRRRPQRVLVFTGGLAVVSALLLFVIASAPPFAVLVGIFILFGTAGALFGPARRVLYVQIVPAHIRTMGVAVFLLADVPATILRFALIGYIVTQYGTQGALYTSAVLILLSSVIELSSAGLFERDMRSALASQSAAAAWREAREAGQGKLLVCRGVDVEYDGVQVLFGVDFDVDDGDIVALLGTNGAGKSTLLKAIGGIHEASSGAVLFDGRDITHMPPHELAARGVVSMPGGRGVFPDLTVAENLMLGNWLTEEDEEGNKRLERVYTIFPVLRERRNERAQLLSGGEQQMLSLGMAFLNKPRLLIIDELSLGLSPAAVAQLIEFVKTMHAEGTTVIVVEQSVNVALTLAERAIFMEKGEVRFVGRTEDLLRRPDILRAVYVKGTGGVGAPRSGLKDERERRRHALAGARPVLQVENVKKSFGGVTAVNDVSFELVEGAALGLIGPNGAGKTTIFDIISGYQTPDSGRVVFDGVDITNDAPEARAKLGLVRRFQDARLFPSLTVYENILIALERQAEVRSMLLTAMQVPQARQAEKRLRRRAEPLMEMLELGAYRSKFVKELSTGLRRITDIACVLATEPKLLLLDEPSTGIAQAESENLAPLLRRVRHETGCTMLIIEHDMPLISELSDELLAMDQGQTVIRGTPEQVLNDDRVVLSYLGTSNDVIQRSGVRGTKGKVGQRR